MIAAQMKIQPGGCLVQLPHPRRYASLNQSIGLHRSRTSADKPGTIRRADPGTPRSGRRGCRRTRRCGYAWGTGTPGRNRPHAGCRSRRTCGNRGAIAWTGVRSTPPASGRRPCRPGIGRVCGIPARGDAAGRKRPRVCNRATAKCRRSSRPSPEPCRPKAGSADSGADW